MIRLQRTRQPALLGAFTGAQLQTKLRRLLTARMEHQGPGEFKPAASWSTAKARLRAESFDKCAYCEARVSTVAHGDVEHFRPKSIYWWLAYCYDNYTFGCQVCNQVHKGNGFEVTGAPLAPPPLPQQWPLAGPALAQAAALLCPDPAKVTDAQVAQWLGAEDAHLPNPYLEDPELLFGWHANLDTAEVSVVARDASPRARRALKAAEDLLGLNRAGHKRDRFVHHKLMLVLARVVQDAGVADVLRRDALAELLAMAGPDRPYAAMCRYFLRQWGLLPPLP